MGQYTCWGERGLAETYVKGATKSRKGCVFGIGERGRKGTERHVLCSKSDGKAYHRGDSLVEREGSGKLIF